MNVTLFVLFSVAQDGPPPLPELPRMPSLPALRRLDPYEAALHESARAGKPLVVFVGQPERAVGGCLTVREDGLEGVPKVCVVVRSAGGDKWMIRGRPSEEDILKKAFPTPLKTPRADAAGNLGAPATAWSWAATPWAFTPRRSANC